MIVPKSAQSSEDIDSESLVNLKSVTSRLQRQQIDSTGTSMPITVLQTARPSCYETARNAESQPSLIGPPNAHYSQGVIGPPDRDSSQSASNSNITSIKTELKDKIQLTRERFNQLKQRKRGNQQSTDACCLTTASTLEATLSTSSRATPSIKNLYNTYRSQSKTAVQGNATMVVTGLATSNTFLRRSFKKREDSQHSDNVDRDEEAIPVSETLPILSGKNQSLRCPVAKNGIKASFYRSQQNPLQIQHANSMPIQATASLPSYKLDGAKLLVNRLQAQLKNRFSFFLEAVSQLTQETSCLTMNSNQLKEKWKFVRSVMDNMEKHKKIPLYDKTNSMPMQVVANSGSSQQSKRQVNGFNQIQQMFENFKHLRASGQSQNSKQSTVASAILTQAYPNDQENQNPLYTLQNVTKIASKSKDAAMSRKRASKHLPPHFKKLNTNTCNTLDLRTLGIEPVQHNNHKHSNSRESLESFTSTYRENDYFINYQCQQDQNAFPNQMLTSRSNLVLEEEACEGLQQLPLESPMNADKFVQRRLYLKQDQLQQIEYFKRSLGKLAEIQNRIKIRQSFAGLQKRCKAHNLLDKLLKRRIQEDKLRALLHQKGAFVKLIKNCIFKSKLGYFLERANQRLLEKGFDKIKENNWVLDERKEMLEAILAKQRLKQAFRRFSKFAKAHRACLALVELHQSYHSHSDLLEFLGVWKSLTLSLKMESSKSEKLRELIELHKYKKQGFTQFKAQVRSKKIRTQAASKVVKLLESKLMTNALAKWRQHCESSTLLQMKHSILINVISLNSSLKQRHYFSKWKQLSMLKGLNKRITNHTATYLIVKPLLKSKERKLKQLAFDRLYRRVTFFNKVKKQLKLLLLLRQSKGCHQLRDSLCTWRMQSMKKAYLLHANRVQVTPPRLELGEECKGSEDSLEKDGESFMGHGYSRREDLQSELVDESSIYMQEVAKGVMRESETEQNDGYEEDDEDFEQLTQIKRLSFEEANIVMKTMADAPYDEEYSDVLEPLGQLGNRSVSDNLGCALSRGGVALGVMNGVGGGSGPGRAGKPNQNLRYK